ncbi:phosphoglycolate phosphatase [Leeia aquatica]|uniref:Phosphoglycolate phosphatase n=1 Tax=Leeia aquatica TaxID=2725557 RepID=A0A847SA17_9NEIS|nr:phosphoglycolate phosphatase [Leeia aquatica]NLR74396.1 phosphoglycolate phosphatase [Leeia aquatica]
MIRAVAFDLDGTLIDSLQDLAAAANQMRSQLGLPALPAERVGSYVGDGAAVLVARTLQDNPAAQPDDSPQQATARAAFHQAYLTGLSQHTRCYPGIRALLDHLQQQGHPLALVTNKPLAFTTPLLHGLDLHRYFTLVLGGDSLPEKKPSALPLLHVAQALDCPPAQLLMVGDSRNDLLAARAASCPMLWVDWGYGDPADAAEASGVVSTAEEVGLWVGEQVGLDVL